jgi:hypothetical protein
MRNKQGEEKKRIGDRVRRLGEFWSMLESIGALWSRRLKRRVVKTEE